MNPTETVTILDSYRRAGFRLVPLRPEDKKPKGKDWQRRAIPPEEVEQNLDAGGGVGIQVGECSGWLCAVDLDSPEARELAPRFLPATLTSGKETEARPSHYAYISEGASYKRYQDTNLKELIALKASNNGAGHQFVVEPSVHERKGPYKWTDGFNPAQIKRISYEDLERRLGRLAAASLIARHLPTDGRHEYAMQLAGFLLRHGETTEGALELIRPAWEIADAPREAFEDLDAIVEDTHEKLENDEPTTGGRKLNEAVPNLPQRIAKALGWQQAAATADGTRSYMRTDDGNALRFADRYAGLVRYCPPWHAWLIWDGQRWNKDAGGGAVMRLARENARSIFRDAAEVEDEKAQKAITQWALQSQSKSKLDAALGLAKTDERIEVEPDAFDADPWLLNVENGTIDLRTGGLREPRPRDLITKLAPVQYDPHARADRFEQFIDEIFGGDAELGAFVRRFAGYSLTGSTRERKLVINHGEGMNGKSTLIELLRYVLGDYARSTDAETLLAKKYAGVGNDVAALKGARFVSTSEIDKGRRLAESKVKQLTGSDTLSARFLYGEYFDFQPEFKLWISTNHRPEIQGTENAIWDRVRLVPFDVRFDGEGHDEDLSEKLQAEAEGVLAWLVRGCLEWLQDGLGSAAKVDAATQEYRDEMDTLAGFLADRCVQDKTAEVLSSTLYGTYKAWCDDSRIKAETRKSFGDSLKARGFENFTYNTAANRGKAGWRGVGLSTGPSPEPDAEDSMQDEPPSSDESSNQGQNHAEDSMHAEDMQRIEDTSSAAENGIGKPDQAIGEDMQRIAEDTSTNFASNTPRVSKSLDPSSASSASSASGIEDESKQGTDSKFWAAVDTGGTEHECTFSRTGDGLAPCRECGISYEEKVERDKRARNESGA